MNGEICILRHDDRTDSAGVPSDHVVGRRRQAAVGNMLRLVPQGLEPARQSGRELSIDKETQLRAPEHRMIMLACCKFKNRNDVLGFQVGQVLQDFLARRPRRQEFQHVRDTDAQPADAGSPPTHGDVCRDPIHLAQHQLLQTSARCPLSLTVADPRGGSLATSTATRSFASAEGKKGGEFYTPRCVVKVLVEMLEPYRGRVCDPCCGSSGMFVQSVAFIRAHAIPPSNRPGVCPPA